MSIMSEADVSIATVSKDLNGVNAAHLAGVPNNNAADDVAKVTEKAGKAGRTEKRTSVPESLNSRSPSARALAARIARRNRLADQIRAEHPSYTEADIEGRLEQFGA